MSNKSIRIRTTPDNKDKFVNIKIDQEFDFLEILSLKITQEEAYRNFCADYGVVVGRVFVNNGFGIPNARVSIFIPVDDVDKNDPIINGLYPYEVVTNKDIDGKIYNLLPKNNETDNECFTPVGTFPNKREVLDDPEMGHVYCKYYKFTTSTNYAGDYMIFGVPTGNHTIHVDADISDIGIVSQRPYDSISQGSPIQMFDSPTKFKGGKNLSKLIQIKSTNSGVNVRPFWGSVENCEIGISRVDLDLNYNIEPSAIFMGGLFGDNGKNSVNKNCRPRRGMGKICEQNAGEGTIEMIRKTINGSIEKLDIEGGRVIDDKGAWAYQIPMNLDYYYTNEFGELVLSEDPNKGVPTKTSIRFKISMDETGGAGRLITKAKYLIPHNPTEGNPNEIDYEFGELTKDSSFRDLYWNKIYSVSNFISRYQRRNNITTRNSVSLKDVDDCVGEKNPAPFNRVNTSFNPLFFVICLIMKIIESILTAINLLIIPLINFIVFIIRIILGAFCSIANFRVPIIKSKIFKPFFGWACLLLNRAKFIPCIYAQCPFDAPQFYYFAPGCIKGSYGYDAIDNAGIPIITKPFQLSDCIGATMAESLNLFQFDFYNDWLNGSLYYFLLKYKKRKKREKYCNYDCSGNSCKTSLLFDTCYDDESSFANTSINEGLIKKYNNELYYAPTNKTATFKMYATEIINLGSVFNCDWQGVPKIQEYLVPTTYIIPPLIDEYSEENPAQIETSGQVDIGSGFGGMFFDISCAGLKLDKTQTLNVRHACELGVDLDETDEADNGTLILANHNLGSNEINSEYGQYVRDVFFGLNNVTNNINLNLPYTTNFNTKNIGEYNFSTSIDNGLDYSNFRGYIDNTSFSQPKHSFYFYFGITPNSTGLEKMNSKFFTKCTQKLNVDFFIRIDNTTAISVKDATDGKATFTIVSGVGPFEYTISGPNYNSNETLSEPPFNKNLSGLGQGVYTISVTDNIGNTISQTFEIPPPIPLYASAFVSSPNTTKSAPYNGQITISTVGGGSGTYKAALYDSNNTLVTGGTCTGLVNGFTSNPSLITQTPISFCGLPTDIAPTKNTPTTPTGEPIMYNGYYLTVTDTSVPEQKYIIYDLSLNGVSGLNVKITSVLPTCYESQNGSIKINVTGGVPFYTVETKLQGDTDVTNNINGLFASDLPIGTYITTVTDSASTPQVFTSQPIVLSPLYPEMKLSPNKTLLPVQCDPTKYVIYLKVIDGARGLNLDAKPTPVLQNYTERYGTIKANIQFNYDDVQDANGNPIWTSPPESVNYTSGTDFKLEIPSNKFKQSVKIRLCNAEGTCGSNYGDDETDFDISEMKLPPGLLSVDDNVDNSKQCNPNLVTFKFNVSHLAIANYRAPYTVSYQIMPINSTLPTSTSIYKQTKIEFITVNQQPITKNVPNITYLGLNYQPDSCKVRIILTDNVGCVSSPIEIGPIKLPTSSLGLKWNSITSSTDGFSDKTFTMDTNSGIPPYKTIVGLELPIPNPTPAAATSTVPTNFIITATVEDSVGCQITKSSNQS
jgi:hypothetical protein